MASNMERLCLDDWTAEWVIIASNGSHIVDDIGEILRDTVRCGHYLRFVHKVRQRQRLRVFFASTIGLH